MPTTTHIRPLARRAATVALFASTALAGVALPAQAAETTDATVPTTTSAPGEPVAKVSDREDTKHQDTKHQDTKHQDTKHQDTKNRDKGHRDTKHRKQRRHFERVDDRVRDALRTAMAQRGDAYSYGAAGPNTFDCSGLIYYSFRRAGFSVPRTSSAQSGAVRRIAKSDMRSGDLMFFTSGSGVYHAAIFLRWDHGSAVMVHAPSTGSSVQVARPWTSSWFAGTLRPTGTGVARA